MNLIKKVVWTRSKVMAVVFCILFIAFFITWQGPLYWFYCYLIKDFDVKPYFGTFDVEELLPSETVQVEISWDLGAPCAMLTQQESEELIGIISKSQFKSILWNPSGNNLYWGEWGEQVHIAFVGEKPIFNVDSCRQERTRFWLYDDKLIAVIRVLSRKRAGDGENITWRLTTSFAYVNESPELVDAVKKFVAGVERPVVDETPYDDSAPKSVLVHDENGVAPPYDRSGCKDNVPQPSENSSLRQGPADVDRIGTAIYSYRLLHPFLFINEGAKTILT